MESPTPEVAAREAIRHWSRLPELADFAARRHGFGDSDGGFGVTYPGDLDDHDRKVDGTEIPAGYVQVYGFWGPPNGYELLVRELVYLDALAAELLAAGHSRESARVQSLAERQRQAEHTDSAVGKFLADLESIPWFKNIGRPLPPDAVAERLRRWEDWLGPEEPAVLELFDRQQARYDELTVGCHGRRAELQSLWDQVHKIVFARASVAVPYSPDEDSWHGPTAAVWAAAWTAGLVALYICLGRPIPDDLQQQWNWYLLGHWPAGYTAVRNEGRHGPLLIY